MLKFIFNLLWSVISFVFNLIWKIISHFWYILLFLFCIWLIIRVISTRRDEKWLDRYEKSLTPDDKALKIIAEKVCSKFKRVELQSVYNFEVEIEVSSQSGNSTWKCLIDFNDNGKLTGEYRIISSNDQSNIPQYVAEAIREEIIKLQ